MLRPSFSVNLFPFFLVLYFSGAFLLLPFSSSAQLNNAFISDNISLHDADSNLYGISLQSNAYLRNTEYFNNIEVGRTLFGYQLNPSFFIQPKKNMLLQAGVFVRNDYGSKSVYTQAIPTFTFKLINRNTSYLFGTLEGALAHQMAEPLIDISSAIERRIENGFQLKHVSEKTFFDLWINWERFIQRGSPYKEEFTAGFNYTPVLFKTSGSFSLSLPVQFIAHHRGGQIDTDTSHLIMVFNGALGLSAKQEFKTSFVSEIKFDVMRLQYRENSNSGYFPFRNGNGNYANLFVKTKWLGLMLSYWNGNSFIAPRGTAIYQSISIDKPGYTESNRQLLFIRFLYEKEIMSNVFLVVRYEPFYDIRDKLSDFSYSVYLTYRDNFVLGRLKR